MKTQKKLTAILLLFVAFSFAQTQTFYSRVKFKNIPLASASDSILMVKSNGLVRYIPKSEFLPAPITFSNGLELVNGVAQLGGRLDSDTVIDGNYEIEFGGQINVQNGISTNGVIDYNGVSVSTDDTQSILGVATNNIIYKTPLTLADLNKKVIPAFAKSSYAASEGEIIRDSEDNNALKVFNNGYWCKIETTCEIPDMYGLALGNTDYINYGDIQPQPNEDFSATFIFKVGGGERAVLLSRTGGVTGILFQIRYAVDYPDEVPLPDEPAKVEFQFGQASSFISRELPDLINGQEYKVTIEYSGSNGRIGALTLNDVSVLQNSGSGTTVFNKDYTIDYSANEFTSRNIDALFGNVFAGIPNGTPDIRGFYSIFEAQYSFGSLTHTYPIEENTGSTFTATEGNTATLVGTAIWENKTPPPSGR